MKVRQAILSILQDGGGSANIDVDTAMSDTSENAVANKVIKKYVDERAEQAYGQANEYTDEEIEHIEGVLNARIDSLEGGGGSANIEGSEFISVKDGKVGLDVDIQGGLGNTGQGLGILEIPSADIITDALGYEPIKEEDISHVIQSVDTLDSLEDVDGNQYVKYTPQYLTEEQKAQARENIGVSEAIDLGAFVTREEFEGVTEDIANKVDKEEGKGLSTEDFTTLLKQKLLSLENYDDTAISDAVESLQRQIDTLVSGNATVAIESFNEIMAFLEGIEDSENLDSIIASIEQQISTVQGSIPDVSGLATKAELADKQDAISDLATIRSGAALGATALQKVPSEYVTESELSAKGYATTSALANKQDKLVSGTNIKTINGQSILGEGDIEIQGGGNASIEVDAELSDTSENAVSNKAVTMALAETEEVAAAALNELNKRFENYALKEEIDAILEEVDNEINHIEGVLEATIIEDEEVTAAALNDLDKRVTSLEQNGGGGNSGGGEGGGTSDITIDSALSTTSTNPVQNKIITTELNKKVDAVSGKGLSTNDYTTTEKNKLSGIASGAEVNVQSDWNATSGDAFIKNKPTFATINGQRIDQGGEITIEGGSGGSGGGEVSGDFVTRTEIVENESVIATALTDIDERLVNTDANIADNNNAIKQLNDTLEELNESIIDNENVLATTLIDLRDRIQNTDDNLTQSNNEKSELAAIVEELISRVAENERVIAAALTDLEERIEGLSNN
jgi:hypothetical protein